MILLICRNPLSRIFSLAALTKSYGVVLKLVQQKEKLRAQETARQVQARIGQDDLSPVPEVYELLYVYFSRSNPDVVRAIDEMLQGQKVLTDELCQEIYEEFLSTTENEEKVRQAGVQIQAALSDVSGIVSEVTTSAKDYTHTLENVKQDLQGAQTQAQIESVISNVSAKTQSMILHNRKLEEELLRSANMMHELKRDLEHARREALTDSLTGLSNRKAFDEKLLEMTRESKESGNVFTLLMVDIDHFKSFNDNFGHQVGDQVLRLVARTLRDGLKGYDFAARYGGEEFAILLPDTEMPAGLAVGNSLRKAIAMKDVVNRNTGDVLGRITMSVGVAEYSNQESHEDIVERADEALYTAKHNGRNQVAAAPIPDPADQTPKKSRSLFGKK